MRVNKRRHMTIKNTKVTTEDLNAIHFYLHEAHQHGLQAEVVTYALKFMKDDPTLTVQAAIALGASEWIK